jgi:hypothetical protein
MLVITAVLRSPLGSKTKTQSTKGSTHPERGFTSIFFARATDNAPNATPEASANGVWVATLSLRV